MYNRYTKIMNITESAIHGFYMFMPIKFKLYILNITAEHFPKPSTCLFLLPVISYQEN